LTGKFNPHLSFSLFPLGVQIHLQQSVHEESNTCHQGDHNTSNENHVNDLVVLMLDIPGLRVSTDLLPKHDDLQEPKVIKLGGQLPLYYKYGFSIPEYQPPPKFQEVK
jgi:hypothetical protein